MFNVGPQEMLVLLLVGVIVFGPDKLPALARQAAQMIRSLRDLSDNARKQISELSPELGEQLGDLSALRKKGLGGLSASSALQKMIFDGDDDPLGMKAHARDEDEPASAARQPDEPAQPAIASDQSASDEASSDRAPALSLTKQPDAAEVASAAVAIPHGAPPRADAYTAPEPELTRAPMAKRSDAPSVSYDDVT